MLGLQVHPFNLIDHHCDPLWILDPELLQNILFVLLALLGRLFKPWHLLALCAFDVGGNGVVGLFESADDGFWVGVGVAVRLVVAGSVVECIEISPTHMRDGMPKHTPTKWLRRLEGLQIIGVTTVLARMRRRLDVVGLRDSIDTLGVLFLLLLSEHFLPPLIESLVSRGNLSIVLCFDIVPNRTICDDVASRPAFKAHTALPFRISDRRGPASWPICTARSLSSTSFALWILDKSRDLILEVVDLGLEFLI